MKNKILEFINNELGTIKVLSIKGELYFNLPDVCRCLELAPENKARELKRMIAQGLLSGNTLCQIQGIVMTRREKQVRLNLPVNYVSEAGLYMTVCGSEKKSAKRFLAWICTEVLPAIRKTGGYIDGEERLPEAERKALNAEKKALKQRICQLENQNAELTDEVDNLNDLVRYYKKCAEEDNTYTEDGVYVDDPDYVDFGYSFSR